jgi:hypothetical protein
LENFLSLLSEDFEKSKNWVKGEVLHLYLLGTKTEYAGHHLASLMLSETAKLGKHLNYSSIATEATNN